MVTDPPLPWAIQWRAAAWAGWKAPRRVSVRMRSHSSGVYSTAGLMMSMPALQTRSSRCPKTFTAGHRAAGQICVGHVAGEGAAIRGRSPSACGYCSRSALSAAMVSASS
ncbi:hypothetical protein SMA5143A_7229 [Streptomyces sp. MA5143a]|nr:hypothetical protein SMA5143A_7229 [Streptomyces sp. MA5143a]